MAFNAMSNNMMNSFENLSSKVPFWNVDLPKNLLDIDKDFEDFEDLDVLCELVRNQYLKRLRQTLLNNLDNTKCYQNIPIYQIQQCVDLCMAEMEKQALRQCMKANIYREGMTNMINQVKTCTNNSMLYVLLKHIIESNNQLSLHDNFFGSKDIKKHSVSVGVNTETNLSRTMSTQTERWMDLENNFSDNFVSNNKKRKTNLVPVILNKPKLPSSYNVKTEISESNVFENFNSLLNSLSCSSRSPPDVGHVDVSNKYESTEFLSLPRKSEQNNSKPNDLSSFNTLLRDLQDSPEYEQSSKLEERLISLGLEIENNEPRENISELVTAVYINPNVIRSNKINEILKSKLKSSAVAKKYELRKSMNDLPEELQTRLNQKFVDLFGNNHDYESDPLSEEEERIIAHKRVVKMVVEFMTPYYKAHRINRHLFKNLAKLISKNLMDRAYDPDKPFDDEETVAKAVNEFFIGNRCIKTTEDIYL